MSQPPTDTSRLTEPLIDAGLVIAICCAAALSRADLVQLSFIGSDSVDPLWRAWKVLTGRELMPPLHSPVAGYALYYNLVPAFFSADSLDALVRHRWLISALTPAPIFLGCRVFVRSLSGAGRWFARAVGLVAALWLALSPELVDTSLSGARTYDAPLWVAVATGAAMATRAGVRWAALALALALPLAAMNHPFALAAVPGALLLAWPGLRASVRWAAGALALAGAVSLPHAVHLFKTFWDRGLGHATDGSSLSEGFWPQLARSFHDCLLVQPDAAVAVHGLMFAGPALLGFAAAVSRLKRAPGWEPGPADAAAAYNRSALLAVGSIVGLAVLIQYLQHYHLRLLFPPLAVAGAWAAFALLELPFVLAGKRGGAGLAALSALVGVNLVVAYWQPHAWDFIHEDTQHRVETLQTHAQLSRQILDDAGDAPRVIDALHIGAGQTLYPPAMVLDQLLTGVPESRFPTRPEGLERARYYISIVAPNGLLDAIEASIPPMGEGVHTLSRSSDQQMQGGQLGGVLLVSLADAATTRDFSLRLCGLLPEGEPVRAGTVYNYMAPMDSGFGAGWVGLWFHSCLLQRGT